MLRGFVQPFYVLCSTLFLSFVQPLFRLHKTMFSLHRTMFILHKTMFSLHRTMFILHKTMFIPHKTMFSLHRTMFSCLEPTAIVNLENILPKNQLYIANSGFVWQFPCDSSKGGCYAQNPCLGFSNFISICPQIET